MRLCGWCVYIRSMVSYMIKVMVWFSVRQPWKFEQAKMTYRAGEVAGRYSVCSFGLLVALVHSPS